MEVHHHSHSENKRFKDYLIEGVMIFVAVTMGFFAERLREHLHSKQREKEYINSLIDNLEEDNRFLNKTIVDNRKKVAGLDSLLSLNTKVTLRQEDKRRLYTYCHKYVLYYSGFSSNDATLIQLKNAGGLQYIERPYVADSIAMYDMVIRNIYAAEIEYGKAINNAIDEMTGLLVLRAINDTTYSKNGNNTSSDLPLLTNDPKKMEVFSNKIFLERGWTQNYVDRLEETLQYTMKLSELLKKEYD